jgi:type VI secretion system secreted protein VgrG
MKKCKHILALAATICFVCGLLFSVFVLAQVGTTVSISAPTQVAAGTDFIAIVNIGNVAGFNAANFDVTFNPAILKGGNATSGLISSSTIPVDLWMVISHGKLRVIQNVPGLSGVSGSGYLSQIQFHVIGSVGNTSQINLTNGVLSDNSANEIPANWIGDTVYVDGNTQTPTPTPTPVPRPTPTPTATPTPTLKPISGGAGASGGYAPTPTPTPTPTLVVTPSPPPTPLPAPTLAGALTPTPTAAAISPTPTPTPAPGVPGGRGL